MFLKIRRLKLCDKRELAFERMSGDIKYQDLPRSLAESAIGTSDLRSCR
jgi:hypothetical protein